MNETLAYLKIFARFPFALRRFLNNRITIHDAQRIIRERMSHRAENFLRLVEKCVYGHPRSPYLALLKMAGCEFDDLRRLVEQKGIEGTLRELRQAGVYITFEEFKGRKPIERNGMTLPVTARDFDNPFARRDYTLETGGSTGLSMQVNQALDFTAAIAPYELLQLSAAGMVGAPIARWSLPLPADAYSGMLQLEYFGQSAQRWFSPNRWRDSKYWYKYAPATFYMVGWANILGAKIPYPEIVLPDQALDVAQWMRDQLKAHGRCYLITSVSRALRVCLAAEQAGFDLVGAVFRGGGEPLTTGKARAIERVGARITTSYASVEAGVMGKGCFDSTDPADVHFLHDGFALITHPHLVPGVHITVPAFNLTGFLDALPKIMLNLQYDDYGIVEERQCNCAFNAYGYTTHLREIRSYSKLVSEGATLIGNEMIHILEQVLPAQFGGSPLDYQLFEHEDEQGFTKLYLLIHPRIEITDEQRVIETVYNALSRSSPMADAARATWQQSRTLQLKRQPPIWTAGGKFMPLYIQRRGEK